MVPEEYGSLLIPSDLISRLELDTFLIVAPAEYSTDLGGFDLAVDIHQIPSESNLCYNIPIREDSGSRRDNAARFFEYHNYDRRLCLTKGLIEISDPLINLDLLTYTARDELDRSHPLIMPESLSNLYHELRHKF